MGAVPPDRQYSSFIVTRDVWPTTREACVGKAAVQRRLAAATASAVDAHRVAIHGLQAAGVAQSKGFEAMHGAYWRFQVEADNKAETDSAAADLIESVATIQHSAERRIDSIDAEAHHQLSLVPSRSPIAIGIITSAAALARRAAVGAAEEIQALSGQFGLRFGPAPESPPSGDPVPSDDADRSTEKRSDESPERPADDAAESSASEHRESAPQLPDAESSSANTIPRVSAGQALLPPSSSRSPSMPKTGGAPGVAAGGIGSSGVGLGSSPSLSTPSSASGLGSSVSGSYGMSAGGMASPGSASSPTSTSTSRAATLSRPLPVAPPAPLALGAGASPTAASPASVAASAVPQPLASSGATHAPVVAASGAVPPSALGSLTAPNGPYPPVAAAALLPPGPMGPPSQVAATVAPTAGAGPPVGSPTGAMAPATASVATAAMTTPVATLPSRVAAAAARDLERQRNESNDLQFVKQLAWELLYATESGRSFALWAVGVMYSGTGERQVIALTHHGAGYVPAGIAVPDGVQMLWSDPAVGEGFRQRWNGNLDPAATLVAYAELKAAEPAVWRLAAAATTWSVVAALMTAAQRWGTEWATCSAMNMPASIGKRAFGSSANPAHRLVREFPELSERVAQLRPRGLDRRAARLITDALVADARLAIVNSIGPRIPSNFEMVWPTAADGRVDASERARFAEAVQQQWFSIAMVQPGWDEERSESSAAEYRAQWLICRMLEVVLGWIADDNTGTTPASLPLDDMVYAAAHAYLDSRGNSWITDLFASEEGRAR